MKTKKILAPILLSIIFPIMVIWNISTFFEYSLPNQVFILIFSSVVFFALLYFVLWDSFIDIIDLWRSLVTWKKNLLAVALIVVVAILSWKLILNAAYDMYPVVARITAVPVVILSLFFVILLIYNLASINTRLELFIGGMHSFLKEYATYLQLLFVLSLIAYGFLAYNITFVGDDWEAIQQVGFQYNWVVQIGRWMARPIWTLMDNNTIAPAFSLSMFIVLGIISGIIMSRTIGIKDKLYIFIYTSLFLFVPFLAELLSFKMAHVVGGVAILFSSLFGLLSRFAVEHMWERDYVKSVFYGLLAATFFAFAAANYQSYVFYGTISVLGFLFYFLIKTDHKKKVVLRKTFGALVELFLILVVGGIIYIFSFNIALEYYDLPPTQNKSYSIEGSLISNFEELRLTIDRTLIYIKQFLFEGHELFPLISKYIFWIFIILLFSHLLNIMIRRKKYLSIFISFIILALIFFTPWTLGLLRLNPAGVYRYNSLASLGAVYAVVIAIGLELTKNASLKLFTRGLSFILIFIFVFQQNVATSSTYLLNQRDFYVANRIIEDIEAHPEFSDVILRTGRIEIIILGSSLGKVKNEERPFSPPGNNPPMRSTVASCGVFDCQLRRLAAAFDLIEYKNLEYQLISYEENIPYADKIKEIAFAMPNWPADGSIDVYEGYIILKFSDDGINYND